MSRSLEVVPLGGPAALRALAGAFAHLDDFQAFVTGLQAALDRSQMFERMQLQLDRGMAQAEQHFSPGAITLPLARDGTTHGTLQIAPGGEHRQFGAEDLHLMAGLADLLSAVLAQALRAQDARRTHGLFRLLLNQAPVGIAAFAADGRRLIANDLAGRWLGEAPPPLAELAAGEGGFHLRASGKLIYGEARRMPPAEGEADWLVVLHDLTPEQVRLLEQMKREVYRALVEGRPLGFALIEGPGPGDGILRRLGTLRGTLAEGEIAGPYDAHRVGVVLGGAGSLELRNRLRRLRACLGGTERLRLGYAELGRDGRAPEQLLQAALQRHGGYDEILRPALLVHEPHPEVAQTLAMVLGRDFRVVVSGDASRTRALLQEQVFEGLVAELDPKAGPAGTELASQAAAWQPGIRTFLTTVQAAPADPLPENAVVIGKPFDVAALRETVRRRLGD